MKPRTRTVVIWLGLLGVLFGLYVALHDAPAPLTVGTEVLLADAATRSVASIRVEATHIVVTRTDGATYATPFLDEEALWDLQDDGIPVEWAEPAWSPTRSLLTVLPLVLLLGALIYFVRRARAKGVNEVLGLRRSRARLVAPGKETLTFKDVGGAVDAKARLADVVDYLKHPARWADAGVRLPRGVLLEGPPGTGKTLLARAVAGEAGVPFFVVSASEFVEMFVGIGAARVRDLFETALKAAPAVIFIDELDAVGRRRGSGVGSGHDEREQTLNQLLVCLDGFERNARVVVLAATNRSDILDKALLRPGRFDLRIPMPPQGAAERAETLAIHMRGKKLAADVTIAAIAARTEGFTGASLEHVANEAALTAVRRSRGGGDADITGADLDAVFAALASLEHRFDALDAVLMESASQVAQPSGATTVRVTLVDGSVLEGALVWADASFVKIDLGGEQRIVAKRQVRLLEARPGTAAADEIRADAWANHRPGLA